MSRPKVFGIGFQKTGTTSLGIALRQLGYSVTGPNRVPDPSLAAHHLELALSLVPEFDAFQDNPWPLLFREMDERFPGSKFVLTLRPLDEWMKSLIQHSHRRGNGSSPIRQFIYGAASPVGNEELYRRVHQQHIDDVLRHFDGRPLDLLTLRITEGDGWEQLCPFLGVDIPNAPFPHSNKAPAEVALPQDGRVRRLLSRVAPRSGQSADSR